MLPNFLPTLDDADKLLLREFAAKGSAPALTLKRVLACYMEHFRDIRNIDPLENVGLQACSHLRAYDMLEEIFSELEFFSRTPEGRKTKSFK